MDACCRYKADCDKLTSELSRQKLYVRDLERATASARQSCRRADDDAYQLRNDLGFLRAQADDEVAALMSELNKSRQRVRYEVGRWLLSVSACMICARVYMQLDRPASEYANIEVMCAAVTLALCGYQCCCHVPKGVHLLAACLATYDSAGWQGAPGTTMF